MENTKNNGVVAFAAIIDRLEAQQRDPEVVTPLLVKIEHHTAILPRMLKSLTTGKKSFNESIAQAHTAAAQLEKPLNRRSLAAWERQRDEQGRFVSDVIETPRIGKNRFIISEERQKAKAITSPGELIESPVIADVIERDERGRFAGKSRPGESPENPEGRLTLFGITKRHAKMALSQHKEGLMDIAGKGVFGGVGWEALMQGKEAISDYREKLNRSKESGLFSDFSQWKQGRSKKDPATTLEKNEKAEQKRHKEIKELLKKLPGGGGTFVSGGSGGGDNGGGGNIIETGLELMGAKFGLKKVRELLSKLPGGGAIAKPVSGMGRFALGAMPALGPIGALSGGLWLIKYLIDRGGENGWHNPLPPELTNTIKPLSPSATDKAKWREPQYDSIFNKASEQYGIDSSLLKGIGGAESGFNAKAKSNAGAEGIMQLMPRTARALGVTDVTNPTQNIMAGTRHLAYLLKKYNGNETLALQAYNGGDGNVDAYLRTGKWPTTGGDMPQETKDYPARVRQYQQVFSPNAVVQSPVVPFSGSKKATTTATTTPATIIPATKATVGTPKQVSTLATIAPAAPYKPEKITSSQLVSQQSLTIPGLDNLNSSIGELILLNKAPKREKEARSIPTIRTDFDDTFLTLMAYDRI